MIPSRSGSQGSSSAPPQSIEAVRRRARHRLIGASVRVAIGVIGFPLLFESQPRPIAVDIPIGADGGACGLGQVDETGLLASQRRFNP